MADEQKQEHPGATELDPVEPPPQDEGATEKAEQGAQENAAPDAILARMQSLGAADDGEGDDATREAEAKLAERRAAQGERSKLQDAASKKLDKIGTKPKKKKAANEAAAAERRAQAKDDKPAAPLPVPITELLQKHAKTLAAVVGGALLIGFGALGYRAYSHHNELGATRLLMQAEALQHGAVGPAEPQREDAPPDRRPRFDTEAARAEAALAKFRAVSAEYSGSGPATLAKLSEGALLLDLRDSDGALAAFQAAKDSALGKTDQQVRGRALEGAGFAHELKGDLEAAAKSFRELENTVELPGFKELALYHQGRVAEAQGDKDKAKELLKAAYDKASDPRNASQMVYVKTVAEERLRVLDPNALPKDKPLLGAGAGGGQMGEAELRAMQEMIQKQIEEAQKKAAEGQGESQPQGTP